MNSSIRLVGIASTLALTLAACATAPARGIASVSISPSTAQTVAVGESISFTSAVTRVSGDTSTSNAKTFVSTNPAVLTIDQNTGMATGVSAGMAEVYARSTFDPTKMSSRVAVTVTPSTTPASQVVFRLNAGGPAIAASGGGVAWSADDATMWVCSTNATGGATFGPETTPTSTTGVVNAAVETQIYNTERYCLNGNLTFTYPNLAAGTYTVRVHLSETNRTGPNMRVLNFTAYAGTTAPAAPQVTGVDVFRDAPGQYKALVVDVAPVTVATGATGAASTLTLLIENTVPEAFVRGIEIIKTN